MFAFRGGSAHDSEHLGEAASPFVTSGPRKVGESMGIEGLRKAPTHDDMEDLFGDMLDRLTPIHHIPPDWMLAWIEREVEETLQHLATKPAQDVLHWTFEHIISAAIEMERREFDTSPRPIPDHEW